MKGFLSFRHFKKLLKIAGALCLLAAGGMAWGTDYTWTGGGGSDTNWTKSENWTPSTGSPTTGDTVYIPGTAETTITINSEISSEISIENITLNSAGSELITIILNSDLTCTDTLYFVHKEDTPRLGNVLITGSGKFTTKAFDFPNRENTSLTGHHKFEIDSSATLKITNTFYGDANIQLDFTGSGTLDLPASGINLDYGTKKVNYGENLQITSSSPLSYYQRLADTTIPASGTITNFPANVVLTKKIDVYYAKPTYLYTATVIGEENITKFTLNGTTLKPGITSGTLTIDTPSSTGTASSDYGYKQSFTLSHTGTGTGDGISITIYAPDESGLEISTIKYNCDVNTWLGTTSSDASKANNWSNGVPADANQYVAIGFPKKNYPELSDGSTITCKSIILSANSSLKLTAGVIDAGSITCNGTMTQSSGTVKTQSIIAGSTGSFTQTEGTLELRNDGTTPAKISGSVAIKNLSIAEGAEFTMPFDMNLTNLNLNAGAKFSKGGHNLTIGWLMAATDNYSEVAAPDITLSDAFEADSIIILLRNGNITATNTLSARKDFIIGGAIYNSSIIKYEAFVNRPSNWVPSFTNTSLDITGTSTEGSAFKLSDSEDGRTKGLIKIGTSGKGNFYINGANFTGTSSGGNDIIIPPNDSAENFCADAIHSTITNINVVCTEGTNGDGSPKAMIPTGGCSLSGCTNFDSTPFEIISAETVFDNKIKITMNRETRNTQGELNDPKIINTIKVSDGNYFTSTEVPQDTTINPDSLRPTVFYIETNKTTWNMDATGSMNPADPQSVLDACNYTDSKSQWRTVVPCLTIPQTGEYGYTITDKWGKHIEPYSPYTGTTDGTDKTPTWSGQDDTSWTKKRNWYNLHKQKSLEQNLQENDITIKPVTNPPVISTTAASNQSWQVKSMTIAAGASLTIENTGMLKTESFTNNGTFTQKGGMLQLTKLTGTSAKIKSVADETQPIKNLELLPGTDLTLESDIYITNLIMEDNTTITRGIAPTIHQLTATNVITYANTGTLNLTEDYSAKNIYFVSGTVNIANPISAENILAYGGTINLTAAASSLKAKKDFIIIGEKYNLSLFKYEHFAKRPAGWAGVNIPLDDFGKLPDGGTVPNFSAKITVFPGASITAGSDALPNSGVTGNLYINGTDLSGTSEWFISIPQNDSPANFCAEAINSTITNCTVKCDADNSTDGSKSQIPTEEIKESMLSGCRNFDKEDFAISKAYTVSDKRIYLEFDSKNRPLRNNNGELADSNRLRLINIGTFTGGTFGSITAAYNSKTGSDLPAANPNEIYIVADTTWNTDATGTYVGSGKYTDSSGHFKRVKPSLYIPQYQFDYDDNYNEIVLCGYLLTDKWGKRLKNYSFNPDDYSDLSFTAVADGIPESEKVPRIPPAYGAVLSSVGGNKIAVTFTKPIVTDSNKISYYTADYRPDGTPYNVERVTITQPMSQLFPRCFELFSIDSAGNPVTSDLQIDKNQSAQIEDADSGYCILTMQLTRNVTLNDIQNLYIRLIQPKGDDGNPLYPDTMYDHITEQKGTRVSFVQQTNEEHSEDGQNYMILKTAHTMSDFAIGAVTPSYAYISNLNTNDADDKDFFKNIYGNGNAAVHDFSKAQKNYGTLPYGQEISIVSKVNLGSDSKSEGDYPPALKLFITDAVDSDTIFPVLNTKFNKSAYAWLPQSSEVLLKDFQSYTDKLNSHFWAAQSELIKKTPANGFIFTIPKESAVQMKPGSQTNFFYLLCDASGAYLPHYFDPICDYENNTYDLSQSVKSPLFVFNLSNNADLFSLSPWYITLKSITEQRGGVTILNNVINAAVGEKTVLKVNMPSSGNLDIMIMTIDGNIVKYLAHGNASAGEHFYYWDGTNNSGSEVARGMYFVIIKAPGIDENRKVMVVK